MILPSPYKCDCCGEIKKESNHWFLLFIDDKTALSYTVMRWSEIKEDKRTTLAWSEIKDVCGEACLVKLESEIRAEMLKRGES